MEAASVITVKKKMAFPVLCVQPRGVVQKDTMNTISAWSFSYQWSQRYEFMLVKSWRGYVLFRGASDVCFGFSQCVQVTYRSTQRQLNITVQKEQRGWWERLCSQERKPVFLAPDFDRWLDESDAELEIKEKVGPLSFYLSGNFHLVTWEL